MSDITFTLTPSHFHDVATRRAASDHLHISDQHMANLYSAGLELTVVATAAQFGMFIAARCINGCTANTIMNMSPKLICDPRPTPLVTKLDVRNGARC